MSEGVSGEGVDGEAGAQPRLVVALRDGRTCEVRGDRFVVGSQEYSFSGIAWAGLVIDPAVQVAPGAPPAPALLLRLRDARDVLLSPAEPPAAWQLLGALHQAHPDLRAPAVGPWAMQPPPPPGYGYGYAYGPAYGYPPRPSGSSSGDTVLAGLSHLGVFLGGWLLPLIVWLTTRSSAPYASRQAKQAFFWQLIFFALIIVAYIAFFAVFFAGMFGAAAFSNGPETNPDPFIFAPFGSLLTFYAVFLGAYLINVIFSIIGAVQAFQGKPFHYPLLGRL